MTHEELKVVAQQLGEHFDAVLILCSSVEDGVAEPVSAGTGNYYARVGMAKEFLDTDRATINAQEIKKLDTEGDL